MRKFSIILLALLVVVACMVPMATASAAQPTAEPGALTLIAGDLGALEVAPQAYGQAVLCAQRLNFKEYPGRTADAAPDLYETKGLVTSSPQIPGVIPGGVST